MFLDFTKKPACKKPGSAALTRIDPTLIQRVFFLSFLVIAAYFLMVSAASAATGTEPGTDTPMGDVLCDVVNFVYGNMGRALATLAIIILGVGATLGKVSWGLAITVAIGISVVFNADQLTGMLTGYEACNIVAP